MFEDSLKMSVPGIKYDDGKNGFATNCFPVRCFTQEQDLKNEGAWLVAHKAEQRRRFKAVLCAKPRTFTEIKEERKQAAKKGIPIVPPATQIDEDDEKTLDGFFLMKHCCVEDPSDLCSVNISCQALTEVKVEDFTLFDNVAYVNAGENILPFEGFKHFPIIRELEMPLNGLRNLKVNYGDFRCLETLDLSYNNLSPDDLMPLGLIPQLRVLNLTGNYLRHLPSNITKPLILENSYEEYPRYRYLEVLILDDNKLSEVSSFASLAGLQRLQQLSLSKNAFFYVPHLMLIDGRHVTQDNMSHSMKNVHKSHSGLSVQSNTPPKPASSSQSKKSILKNTPPLLNGPEHRPLLRSASGSPTIPGKSLSFQEEESPEPTVTFKDEKAEMKQEPEVKSGVEDMDDFAELDMEQINQKVEDIVFEEALEEHKQEMEKKAESRNCSSVPQLPPFPELQSLNLSFNQFTEEEALLALAAWPMLSELLINDNPLTTQHSGNPPLLTRYLQDRLGIRILRHQREGPIKPKVEVKANPERQVNTIIPPFPRCNVEELLALDAAPMSDRSVPPVASRQKSPVTLERTTPLPPITAKPIEEEQTHADNAFFLTQIDAQETTEQQLFVPKPPTKPKDTSHKTHKKGKVYSIEELLQITSDNDETEEEILTPDIRNNVKSLQYILDHPIVFRDKCIELEEPQPPFRPLAKAGPMKTTRKKFKGEMTKEVLGSLRDRNTVIEAKLDDVLKDPQSNLEVLVKDAPRLLTEIQNRYNVVRAESMQDASSIVLNSQIMEKGHV